MMMMLLTLWPLMEDEWIKSSPSESYRGYMFTELRITENIRNDSFSVLHKID